MNDTQAAQQVSRSIRRASESLAGLKEPIMITASQFSRFVAVYGHRSGGVNGARTSTVTVTPTYTSGDYGMTLCIPCNEIMQPRSTAEHTAWHLAQWKANQRNK